MDIFESLESLNVSEECFDEISSLVEEYINEYIKQSKMQQLADVYIKRKNNVKDAPEGPEKEEAQRKLNRNMDLTDNKIERSGSNLQKAVHRGYSQNAKEKDALLNAGWTLKEDPTVKGRHNIVKY